MLLLLTGCSHVTSEMKESRENGIALMESVSSDDPTSLIGLPLMKLTTLLAHAGIEAIDGLGETC